MLISLGLYGQTHVYYAIYNCEIKQHLCQSGRLAKGFLDLIPNPTPIFSLPLSLCRFKKIKAMAICLFKKMKAMAIQADWIMCVGCVNYMCAHGFMVRIQVRRDDSVLRAKIKIFKFLC
ncbi:hypothetical protein HanPSC8_Chr17g0762941 [Helianthus annuus]|nr:hypothetical protein HanPSC8_Chr17g0762941 [Helianthus annuus]